MAVSWIVMIIVILILLAFLIIGAYKGFLRIILTTFSLIITIILAGVLAKPLADFAENRTVIGPRIETKIENYVNEKLGPVSGTVETAETSFIEALPLPAAMKEDLKAKNTVAGYVDQGVDNFAEFIAKNLTTIIIKVFSYVLLFILIFLVLRLILRLSNMINHIPILGGINRLGGAIIGLAEGVLFLWVACMVVMMLSGSDLGIACEKVIRENPVLTFIYEHNYLMDIVNGVLGIFKSKS